MAITEPASVQDVSSGLTRVGYLPGESTARVQEVHRTLLNILCDFVERAFA